jgi:hypothetical protein
MPAIDRGHHAAPAARPVCRLAPAVITFCMVGSARGRLCVSARAATDHRYYLVWSVNIVSRESEDKLPTSSTYESKAPAMSLSQLRVSADTAARRDGVHRSAHAAHPVSALHLLLLSYVRTSRRLHTHATPFRSA